MKTRIAVIIGLLCVVGSPLSASAGAELPTISSGTLEPYLSFMAGIAVPRSEDATFTDGTQPAVVKDVDYQTKHSVGGNAGIWFPTRNKLAGFDLGVEITGFIWYADVACCKDFYNNDPTGAHTIFDGNGNPISSGTTTEVNGLYVGSNFLIRYPMGISEAYPNGRWFPYVGIGVGAHQMATKPGGQRGTGFFRAITEERDTTVGFMGVGGIKVHVFKYVALFAEAKYIHAHHDGLSSDRFGQSGIAFNGNGTQGDEVMNRYASNIDTILAHAGMSIHFDIRP
jgi:opacity protein-like surface antigen